MNGHATAQLDTLFPTPSAPPNSQCPQRWYGVNYETTAALQKTLKENHTKWHIFFNDRGFHNHIAHHVLALYALGASAPVIEAAYELDSRHQRALFESPEAITEENFIDHLGDEKFYKAYLTFFTNTLLEKGAAATLEKFIFSDEYNYEAPNLKDGQSQPKMLVRFYDALMHTMIHVGYGLEFGLMGMVVEGLAQGAVHNGTAGVPLAEDTFKSLKSSGAVEAAAAAGRLASLTLEQKPFYTQGQGQPTTGTHAFSILQRMLADDRLTNIKAPQTLLSTHTEAMDKYGAIIAEHAESWTVDLSKPGELERKVEELSWVNAIFYAIGGWNKGSDFQSDFFLLHLVTSSLFLPAVLAYLTPRAQVICLRTYFSSSLTWWVATGLARFDIPGFFSSTSTLPTPPGSSTAANPNPDTLPSATSPHAITPNPWLPIIQTTIVHPNDHLCKLQRTLAHFERVYGGRAPGYFKDSGLEGAEYLDGSLFVRAAALTADRLGWIREGQDKKSFSFEGFYAK